MTKTFCDRCGKESRYMSKMQFYLKDRTIEKLREQKIYRSRHIAGIAICIECLLDILQKKNENIPD